MTETVDFNEVDHWRSVVLYGLNTSTYKLALALVLLETSQQGKTTLSREDLARAFLNRYQERLKNPLPQLSHPWRQAVMEQIVTRYTKDSITEVEAIDAVVRQAFDDVLPRFHTVGGQPLPVTFYQSTPHGIVLTDAIFHVPEKTDRQQLIEEIDGRWGLLESAFDQKRTQSTLINDIRTFYLQRGYERRSLARVGTMLQAYQDDHCFYCSESLLGQQAAVDHVLPRQVLQHDAVWNLVIAHEFCNLDKLDYLPSLKIMEKLIQRNEALILSKHPLHQQIITDLGNTSTLRRKATMQYYADVQSVIPTIWQGMDGSERYTDPLYRKLVRRLATT
ncbi:HNH endonuclease [Herpetosiphon sp. NSE202]|uniref:HNH endonuclease n=1 Tax=Herpetosiphon sp. NSE202 TaxID=3351349 RepID=UPI00362CCDB8